MRDDDFTSESSSVLRVLRGEHTPDPTTKSTKTTKFMDHSRKRVLAIGECFDYCSAMEAEANETALRKD